MALHLSSEDAQRKRGSGSRPKPSKTASPTKMDLKGAASRKRNKLRL